MELDRFTEVVCLEDADDRFVDMCINANPSMFSAEALDDTTVIDEPHNDVDTLAGVDPEAEYMEIPDEDGYTPSLYDSLMGAANPEIADEDLPEESEFYEDDAEDDTVVTDEELMMAETLDDMLEAAWQRGQKENFWESDTASSKSDNNDEGDDDE